MSLEAAKIRNESNPKPNYQVRGDPYVCGQESTKEGTMFDHEDVEHSTSTERPVCGSKSTKSCVLTPTLVEEDQTSAERRVLVDQREEHFMLTCSITTSTILSASIRRR